MYSCTWGGRKGLEEMTYKTIKMDKFVLGCIFLGLFQQCQFPQKAQEASAPVELKSDLSDPEPQLPTTPRMLRRSMYEHGKILWVYGTTGESSTFGSLYKKLGESLAQNSGSRVSVLVVPDTSLTETELSQNSLTLIGTPSGNRLFKELLPKLPFDLSTDSLTLADQSYTLENRIWNLRRYPNPANPYLSMNLISSKSDDLILSYLEEVLKRENNRFRRNPWDYELWEAGERLVMGYFSHNPENAWEYQSDSHWDYLNKGLDIRESKHFSYTQHGSIDSQEQLRLEQEAEAAYLAMSKELGFPLQKQDFPIHVFESVEAKGLEIGNTDQAHVEFDKHRVCLVAHEAFPAVNMAPLNQMLIRENWGIPQTEFLEEGLANLYTAPWKRGGLEYWGKKLYEAGAIPET